MTLANILRQKLNDSQAVAGRHELSMADEASGWTAYLTADSRDRWSTVAWEVSLRRAASGGDVAAWARRIAEKTGGLLEQLRVVEVDAERNEALVRSAVPSQHDGKASYYEVRLKANSSALVRRYEGSLAGEKRQQIPFVLTNEVLVKFVADLCTDK